METAMTTFAELWTMYEPKSQRDNDSWKSERSRAAHLVRILGGRDVMQLSEAAVEHYRARRAQDITARGAAPSWATMDREVELLKRVVSYGVRCKVIPSNPLDGVELLNKNNTRRSVVTADEVNALVAAARPHLKPLIILAFDTGCRIGELLSLRWPDVDLADQSISLMDTKTDVPRKVYLTARAVDTLAAIRPSHGKGYVFHGATGSDPLVSVRTSFRSAAAAIGRPELWFHDLRRSFVTRARRAGIAESVVMRMSGHKSPSVFRRYNIVEDSDVKSAAGLL